MIRRHFGPPPTLNEAGESEHSWPSSLVVSSLRIERKGGHDLVDLYNRGALAGTLVFAVGDDAESFATMLGFVELDV